MNGDSGFSITAEIHVNQDEQDTVNETDLKSEHRDGRWVTCQVEQQ